MDPVAWATATVNDLRRDLTKAGSDLNLDGRLDEMGEKIRQAVSTPALRTIIARLERELPDTDTDRYERAYTRGRMQARSIYLGLGLAAGATAGVIAALLLDPKNGKARRDAIAGRTSSLTRDLSGRAKSVSDRARDMAIERGLVKPEQAPAETVEGTMPAPATKTPPVAAEPIPEVVSETQPAGA